MEDDPLETFLENLLVNIGRLRNVHVQQLARHSSEGNSEDTRPPPRIASSMTPLTVTRTVVDTYLDSARKTMMT